MKRAVTILALSILGLGLTGCATIVKDKSDTVTILTPNCPAGTSCKISNKKGSWVVQTPNTITVPKSDDSLLVICSTPDGREISGSLESKDGGMIWGNILFGGIIGAVVDARTDASRDYGDSIVLPLCEANADETSETGETEKN